MMTHISPAELTSQLFKNQILKKSKMADNHQFENC